MLVIAVITTLLCFAMTIAGAEVAKEVFAEKPVDSDVATTPLINGNSQLLDKDNQPISVESSTYGYDLLELVNWPAEELYKLETISLPLANGAQHTMTVSGSTHNLQQRDVITVYSAGAGVAYFGNFSFFFFFLYCLMKVLMFFKKVNLKFFRIVMTNVNKK